MYPTERSGLMVKGNGSAKLDELTEVGQVPIEESSSRESWEQAPARIKVIGVGGGGCNCVRRMVQHNVRGVQYAMVNTDIKSLEPANRRIEVVQIGRKVTRGWGAGGYANLGERAAEESATELRNILKNAELVFVTSGMGGGTGTGAAPYVAYLAKEMGALVVGVVTTPFSFEGRRRGNEAISGVASMRPYVDNLIVIHNDRLPSVRQPRCRDDRGLQNGRRGSDSGHIERLGAD